MKKFWEGVNLTVLCDGYSDVRSCFAGLNGKELSLPLVFTAFLQIDVNGIAITSNPNPDLNAVMTRKALALYVEASMFNHHCDAPLQLEFNSRQLTVRSLTNIPRGSQLYISYGPQVSHSLHLWKFKGLVLLCVEQDN